MSLFTRTILPSTMPPVLKHGCENTFPFLLPAMSTLLETCILTSDIQWIWENIIFSFQTKTSLCVALNESHLFSEHIPANQLQNSILRLIIFSWECIKLCVRKYLASIGPSRFQEYSWGFRGARWGNCAHSNIHVWQQENWVLIDYLLFSGMKQSVAESKWINNQIPVIK